MLDLLAEKEPLDIPAITRLQRLKTGEIFAFSCESGGILGKAAPSVRHSLTAYAHSLGLAFQIADDLLDFTGEEQVIGKPVGGDLVEGKMTLPVIHLLATGDARANTIIRGIVERRASTAEEWRELKALLASHGSLDYARKAAHDYVATAKEALSVFPASAEREALLYLPDYVVARDR